MSMENQGKVNTSNNTDSQSRHHHHHHHSKKDETGQYRRKMANHVTRVRMIRKWSYVVVTALAAIVSLAVVYAYIIDR